MVDVVAARDGAELFKVEIGVLDFQRIEGPLDQFDTAGERVFALQEFQATPQTTIAMILADRQHVRVQINVAAARARDRERETNHDIA